MARPSSLAVSGRTKSSGLSVALHSLVVKLFDELGNLKSCPTFCVPLLISFPSHLQQHDGVARLVATCHALVGWTWARSLTRPLVFLGLSFLGRFLKAFSFFFPFFTLIAFLTSILSPFSAILQLPGHLVLPFLSTVLFLSWFCFILSRIGATSSISSFLSFWCMSILRLGATAPFFLFFSLVYGCFLGLVVHIRRLGPLFLRVVL